MGGILRDDDVEVRNERSENKFQGRIELNGYDVKDEKRGSLLNAVSQRSYDIGKRRKAS